MLKPYILTTFALMGPLLEATCCQDWEPHPMRISARHIEGGGIGYNQGYSTLEAFLAIDPNQVIVMPFADVRGHLFNDGRWAVNAGAGFRGIWGCRAYGANVYYDYRNTHRFHYNQIGFGAETLGDLWDLRINGYVPVGRQVSRPYDIRFGGFAGHSVLVNRKFQYSMGGADAELGFHFARKSDFDFYGAFGPYYFKGELGRAAAGAKARIGFSYKDYITFELSDSYDSVYRNKFQGQLTLSFPFGPGICYKPPKSCLANRMVQPVQRQEIVVIDSRFKKKAADNFFIFVDNLSHSAGTFESPYPTLLDAQGNSKPGDYIYVFPGDGTSTGMDQGFVFKNNQQLLSSSSPQIVATNLGTIVIPAQSSLIPIIGNTTKADPVITLANNNVISGFTIDMNSSVSGISNLAPITNLIVKNNTIISTNNSTINLTDVSGKVLISNNTLTTSNFFDPVISIVNSDIKGATYVIEHNYLNTATECIYLDYLDCSAITTCIAYNHFLNDDYSIQISVDNTTSLPENVFNIFSNNIYSQDLPNINVNLYDFANVTLNLSNNIIDSLYISDAFDITLNQQAICNLNMFNNTIRAANSAVNVNAYNSSTFNMVASNNFLGGGDVSALQVITQGEAAANISLTKNTLASIDGNVVDFQIKGSGDVNINISDNQLFPSTYVSAINCTLVPTATGNVVITANNNQISFGELNFMNNSSGNLVATVDGNHFTATQAVIRNGSTGNICLQFNNNVSNPIQFADGSDPYIFSNTGAGALNLETPVGNIGLFDLTDVTPVPPNTCSP